MISLSSSSSLRLRLSSSSWLSSSSSSRLPLGPISLPRLSLSHASRLHCEFKSKSESGSGSSRPPTPKLDELLESFSSSYLILLQIIADHTKDFVAKKEAVDSDSSLTHGKDVTQILFTFVSFIGGVLTALKTLFEIVKTLFEIVKILLESLDKFFNFGVWAKIYDWELLSLFRTSGWGLLSSAYARLRTIPCSAFAMIFAFALLFFWYSSLMAAFEATGQKRN